MQVMWIYVIFFLKQDVFILNEQFIQKCTHPQVNPNLYTFICLV